MGGARTGCEGKILFLEQNEGSGCLLSDQEVEYPGLVRGFSWRTDPID
jgi:hypothetical protein